MGEAEGAQTNKNMAFFKDMITSTKVNSEQKYDMQTTQLACDRTVITTNNPDCMAVTIQTRRIVVLSGSALRCRDRAYRKHLFDWYDKPQNQRAVFDYLKTYQGVADKDRVQDRPIMSGTLRMSVDALSPIMHFLAMVTQLDVDKEPSSRRGRDWFNWFQLFQDTQEIKPKDRITERNFLRFIKDQDHNPTSGSIFKKTNKTTTYTNNPSVFTPYATALGLTDAPDMVDFFRNEVEEGSSDNE
jgi:hypothetical protein